MAILNSKCLFSIIFLHLVFNVNCARVNPDDIAAKLNTSVVCNSSYILHNSAESGSVNISCDDKKFCQLDNGEVFDVHFYKYVDQDNGEYSDFTSIIFCSKSTEIIKKYTLLYDRYFKCLASRTTHDNKMSVNNGEFIKNLGKYCQMFLVVALFFITIQYLSKNGKNLKCSNLHYNEPIESQLNAICDRPRVLQISSDSKFNGQHSFIDFCRILADRELYYLKKKDDAINDNQELGNNQNTLNLIKTWIQNKLKSLVKKAKKEGDKDAGDRKNAGKSETTIEDEQPKVRKVKSRTAFMHAKPGTWNNNNNNEQNDTMLDNESVYYSCTVLSTGMGHKLFRTNRMVNQFYDYLFYNMLEHGPYYYPFKVETLTKLFGDAKTLFSKDPIFLQIPKPVVIISDIRGNYIDLHRWIQICGLPHRRRILFLGGVIDENKSSSLECLAFIAAMKLAYPDHVFMLLGGTEINFTLPSRFRIEEDCAVRMSARIMCSYLPLVARIGNSLCVYSGVYYEMCIPNWHEKIIRPVTLNNMSILVKLILFGLPTTKSKLYSIADDEGFYMYGADAVSNLCYKWRIDRIIRGRNIVENGVQCFFNNQLLSIYSAPRPTDSGTVLVLDKYLKGTLMIHLQYQTDAIVTPRFLRRHRKPTSAPPNMVSGYKNPGTPAKQDKKEKLRASYETTKCTMEE